MFVEDVPPKSKAQRVRLPLLTCFTCRSPVTPQLSEKVMEEDESWKVDGGDGCQRTAEVGG